MITKNEAVKRALSFMECDDQWKATNILENNRKYVVSVGIEGKEVFCMPIAVDKRTGICAVFDLTDKNNEEEAKKMKKIKGDE